MQDWHIHARIPHPPSSEIFLLLEDEDQRNFVSIHTLVFLYVNDSTSFLSFYELDTSPNPHDFANATVFVLEPPFLECNWTGWTLVTHSAITSFQHTLPCLEFTDISTSESPIKESELYSSHETRGPSNDNSCHELTVGSIILLSYSDNESIWWSE